MDATTTRSKTSPKKFVLFMDESGDHNLRSVDPNFPVFCLAGCAFETSYYHGVVRPRMHAFKLRFWDNTEVILHSRDIRKHKGAFSFLGDKTKRDEFYQACNELIRGLEFTILAVVILKTPHIQVYGDRARHPYHLSLEFILERYSQLIRRRGLWSRGYVLAESRGNCEDGLLKEEYWRLDRVGTPYQDLSNLTGIWMEKKEQNIAGLQIADMVAYPIAAKVLRPDVEQPAFDVLRPKIDAAPRHKGCYLLGYGLKVFPQPTLEHHLLWGPKTKRGP
jgi:hypothetical protein